MYQAPSISTPGCKNWHPRPARQEGALRAASSIVVAVYPTSGRLGKQEGPVSGWFRGVLFCGFQVDFFFPGTNPEDEAAPTVGVLTPRARLHSKPLALAPRARLHPKQ